jgi:hypothetical protein
MDQSAPGAASLTNVQRLWTSEFTGIPLGGSVARAGASGSAGPAASGSVGAGASGTAGVGASGSAGAGAGGSAGAGASGSAGAGASGAAGAGGSVGVAAGSGGSGVVGAPGGGAAQSNGGASEAGAGQSADGSKQGPAATRSRESHHRLSNQRPIPLRRPDATPGGAPGGGGPASAPGGGPAGGGASGSAPATAGGDDNGPHLGVDASLSYPWSAQFTLVGRNVNLRTWGDPRRLSLDLFHEPNLSLTLDPAAGLSAQEMVALLNLHWIPPWQREIEVPLSAFLNESLSSGAVSGGVQLQVEQHIVDWFSITASISGTVGGGNVTLSGNGGILFHIR